MITPSQMAYGTIFVICAVATVSIFLSLKSTMDMLEGFNLNRAYYVCQAHLIASTMQYATGWENCTGVASRWTEHERAIAAGKEAADKALVSKYAR